MIEFIPYEPSHFVAISKDNTEGVNGFSVQASADFHSRYPATTALHNGNPVASFGVTPLWDGVSEVWAVFSRRWAADNGSFIAKSSRKWIEDRMVDNHRVQCFVIDSNAAAKKFAEFLGFEVEGRMRKYGPTGEDFIMYARVRE